MPNLPRRRGLLCSWLALALLAAGCGSPSGGVDATGTSAAESPALAPFLADLRALERRGPPYEERELDELLQRLAGPGGAAAESPAALVGALSSVALAPDLAASLLPRLAPALGFDASERVALAWRLAVRPSRERERAWDGSPLEFERDAAIESSLYVFPADLVGVDEATSLLRAARAAAPQRRRLVLTDLPLGSLLAEDPRLHLLPAWNLAYSPWPRDPFLFARRADGGVRLVVRPNVQPGREADRDLPRALTLGLPDVVDREWRGLDWSIAPVPFHAGQWVTAGDSVWISIHSLEPRILERLGASRVPVEGFDRPGTIDGYLHAALAAADDLARMLGRPTRFVHALPLGDPLAVARRAMLELGGGAGFDLDSLVTPVPGAAGRATVLVASVAAGARLLESGEDSELERFAAALGVAPPAGAALRASLRATAELPRAAALERFLSRVAGHLASEGFEVVRLPLLLVPTALLVDRDRHAHPDFQISWNNVVLDWRDSACRAEGFSGGLASGDELARREFAAAGCALDLLPPLRASLVGGGGYRCASNHLRRRRGAPSASAVELPEERLGGGASLGAVRVTEQQPARGDRAR